MFQMIQFLIVAMARNIVEDSFASTERNVSGGDTVGWYGGPNILARSTFVCKIANTHIFESMTQFVRTVQEQRQMLHLVRQRCCLVQISFIYRTLATALIHHPHSATPNLSSLHCRQLYISRSPPSLSPGIHSFFDHDAIHHAHLYGLGSLVIRLRRLCLRRPYQRICR
jgi:hypothetical protein